ncbi:hypothetical protein A5886_001795 [Enterococcus sp. 8G7_MSG3316]|uniref:Uncharacterized protein n=1 Tax=Candidatus Enterococcus testudinis TaxID=1834191 RepID=A0A242A6Q0_9ENTE|nr:hypothetical protein [Enterococcus sp. 8G7_MSG3316]OTN76716.1 hypothetical protein A5886_001795 [Enterococcus sp. 8G7_MSG3316]
MKYEGKCQIQLTDVETGEVTTHDSTNMFTNALGNMLTFPIQYFKDASAAVISNNVANPIAGVSLGGLYLFQHAIAENADNVIPPFGSNNLIGHAGGAYSGAEPTRGTLNENESEQLENGYKFVWDFNTDKANGSIACMCLTSLRGGNFGIGLPNTAVGNVDSNVFAFTEGNTTWGGGFSSSSENVLEVSSVIYTATAGTGTSYTPTSTALVIYKYDNRVTDIGINDIIRRSLQANAAATLIDQKVVTNDTACTLTTPARWMCLGDGKAISVQATSANVIHYAVIDLETATVVDSKVINAVGLSSGAVRAPFTIKGDYLYLITATDTIKKVSMHDGSVTVLAIEKNGITLSSASNLHGFNFNDDYYGFVANITTAGNFSSSSVIVIKDDDTAVASSTTTSTTTSSANGRRIIQMSGLNYPLAVSQYGINSQSNSTSVYLVACIQAYLATINNITPVVKTPAQTMKIIYTVTKQ